MSAFVGDDYELEKKIPGVDAPSAETAAQMRSYVADYGESLVELPKETWNTSVATWTGSHWIVLVDLWTRESGRSDMVLDVEVLESGDGFTFKLHLIYVP